MEKNDQLFTRIKRAIPGAIVEKTPFGRSTAQSVWVDLKKIQAVAQAIRDDSELPMDWLENFSVIQSEEDLVISYFLNSFQMPQAFQWVVRGSLTLPKGKGKDHQRVEVGSVREIWPMATCFEEEAEELFGIEFISISGVRMTRGFNRLPVGMNGFPLRKGYEIPNGRDEV